MIFMRTNLVRLALVLFGLAMPTVSVRSQVLIELTNQVWKYEQSGNDPGAFWDPLHDDALWPQGQGIFAFETNNTTVLNNNVYPYTNTVLLPPSMGGPTVAYFRTHFIFSGNPADYLLTSSNLIDDGFIIYLNGAEVVRYNMNVDGTAAALANPGGEGVYTNLPLNIAPGGLINGDNLLAVAVYQNNSTSSDVVWGTVLHASRGYAPVFRAPADDVSLSLLQGRSTNLNVAVDAAPVATVQWYFDDFGPEPAAPINGATGLNYTITEMDLSKEGIYSVQAMNSLGTSTSPIFFVEMTPDVFSPTVLRAKGDSTNLTLVTITFSETVLNATNPANYTLTPASGGVDVLALRAVYGPSSNIVVLTTQPRDPTVHCNLNIRQHTITDLYGNPLADPTFVRVTVPAAFQDGAGNYNGTQDTQIRSAAPDDASRGSATVISADLEDPAPHPSHTLLRFDNIFGDAVGQVPLGAIINSASLRVYTTDPTAAANPVRVLRMLAPWTEGSTWNSLGSGIDQTNNVETGATDATINGGQDEAFDEVDVTAAVQAWADGAPNYGWALLATSTNGWDWATSENATLINRPRLFVDFTVLMPCNIESQPASGAIEEKQPFTLTVVSRGSDLRYQWYKDDVALPGANLWFYTVTRAHPTHAGTYHVVISNDVPSVCTSADAIVTITADTQAPAVINALGNPDQTTISLVFNDTLEAASATNSANYTLSGGLTVTRAQLTGNTVLLTTSAPRVIGSNYTVNITGVRDDAAARNSITAVTLPLAQRFRVLPFDALWKFDTNGMDLGTAWKEVAYNDSSWPSARALLGYETGSNTLFQLSRLGLNTNNAAAWPLTNAGNAQTITYYLRSALQLPYSSAGATLQIRHVTDDGALYYLNGTEVYRYNMPAGPVTFRTEASSAPTEGVIRNSSEIAGIPCGNIMVAVELHNQSTNSSDILFGCELLVTVPSFQICASQPRISISHESTDLKRVTLSWDPPVGTLQESSDLVSWNTSPNQANPQTLNTAGRRFFRVRVP